MQTYGEKLVYSLLSGLPKNKYFFYHEPTIVGAPTARKNPDFVIVAALLGVIVLEVKDWVALRRVSQHDVEIERRDGAIVREENPLRIAREYAQNLAQKFQLRDELLQVYHGKKRLKFPWMYAVALPNIDRNVVKKCEEQGIWDEGLVFSKQDLVPNKIEQLLESIPSAWKLQHPLTMEVINTLRGVLDPTLVVTDSYGQDCGTETIKQTNIIREPLKLTPKARQQILLDDTFMTQETVEIAESMSVRLVRGVAGSGKTLVLARRAQYLAEQYPDQKLLVLAFNTDLVADLKHRIPGAANLEITNFHKLCSRILGTSWRSPKSISDWLEQNALNQIQSIGLDIDFVAEEIEWRKELELFDDEAYLKVPRHGRGRTLTQAKREVINKIFNRYLMYQEAYQITDWADVPHRVIARLNLGHELRNYYDIILIDEAQDFAPSWIQVVRLLLRPYGHIFLADDPTQSLFRAFSWKQKGLDVQGRTRRLTVPFRCTREITAAAYTLIRADPNFSDSEEITQPDLTTYELASGDKPILMECKDLLEEKRFVEKTALSLMQSGIPAKAIAILCHNKRIVKHWAEMRQQGFYVESFNKMKGLEFRVVILPHLHTAFEKTELMTDESILTDLKRRIFTAMTRARQTLVLSYHGKFPHQLAPLESCVERKSAFTNQPIFRN